MIPLELTVNYLISRVQQFPGIRHADLLGDDRESAERRRYALSVAVSRGLIKRTTKRPWKYVSKTI